MENVKPVRDFVLVEPEKSPEKSSGGLIHLPKTAKDKSIRGKVLAVGPGRTTEHGILVPIGVAVGERVIISEHNMAQGVRHFGLEGPLLVPEMDIEAVIEPVDETAA